MKQATNSEKGNVCFSSTGWGAHKEIFARLKSSVKHLALDDVEVLLLAEDGTGECWQAADLYELIRVRGEGSTSRDGLLLDIVM